MAPAGAGTLTVTALGCERLRNELQGRHFVVTVPPAAPQRTSILAEGSGEQPS